jgi:hypothetical protein
MCGQEEQRREEVLDEEVEQAGEGGEDEDGSDVAGDLQVRSRLPSLWAPSLSQSSLTMVEAWQGSLDWGKKKDASAALRSERVRGREGARERGRRQFTVQTTSSWKVKKPPAPREKDRVACVAGLGAGVMLDAIIARHLSAGGDNANDSAGN